MYTKPALLESILQVNSTNGQVKTKKKKCWNPESETLEKSKSL